MKHYIVETHVGAFDTYAVSERKAISNVRYRLYGRSGFAQTTYWTVREVA